jgi:membrane protein DedA with SNARE-associated domain
MEDFILSLRDLDPWMVYAAVLGIAFIENLFPPSPSDLAIVFAGSLAAVGSVSLPWVLLAATAGSTLGFVAMYGVGAWAGRRILDQGKIRFIPAEAVRKAEVWFARHGLWLIVANRFLAGTRAVVSFFAGMSHLPLPVTAALSFVSALVWNSVLVGAGYALGQNWERIGFYLTTYSQVITGVVVLAGLVFAARIFYRRNTGAGGGGKG